jgi:hypothetical protein
VLGFPGPSLNSEADEALRAVLARARAEDPRDRPEPGTLAALAHDAVKPVPVRLPAGSALISAAISGPVPIAGHVPLGAHTPSAWRTAAKTLTGSIAAVDGKAWAAQARRRATMQINERSRAGLAAEDAQPRTTTVSVFATMMIAAGVVAGITAGVTAMPQVFGGESPAAAAPSPEASATKLGGISPVANAKDPAGAAAELTSRRLALLAGAVSDINTVNVEGSPAYLADKKILDELKRSGAQVVGASADVQSMEVVTMGPGAASALHSATTASSTETDGVAAGEQASSKEAPIEAVVRIAYTITAHMQVSDSGETAVPASKESADLTLVWTPQGWRVSEVR